MSATDVQASIVALTPRRDWHRADLPAFPDQIGDDPVLFPLLNGLEVEPDVGQCQRTYDHAIRDAR